MHWFRSSSLLAMIPVSAWAQSPAELVPWSAPTATTSRQIFMGVVNPEATDAGMVFSLDATMTTLEKPDYVGQGFEPGG